MKFSIIIVAVIFLSACSNLQRYPSSTEGGVKKIGNGGGACVCRDIKTKQITFAELIDITDAKAKGLILDNYDNVNTYEALVKLFQNYPKAREYFYSAITQIKKTPLQNSEKFDLTDTADFTSNSCKKYYPDNNCQYEQVAIYRDQDKELTYSEEIYSKFSPTSKLALDLHEFTYLSDRVIHGAVLSDNTKLSIGELLSGNPQRVLQIVSIPNININTKLSNFTERYKNEFHTFNYVYDFVQKDKIKLGEKIEYETIEYPRILNELNFIKKINEKEVLNERNGIFYDFNDKDEVAVKLAYNRILEIFSEASVQLVNFRLATEFSVDSEKYYKKFISSFATVDDQLANSMLLCNTIACIKHLYDAQREILEIGQKLDKIGFNGSKAFEFSHSISSVLVKSALFALNSNYREQNNFDKLTKKVLQIFLNSSIQNSNIGELIFKTSTIGIDDILLTKINVKPSYASLANEIKVLQYLYTRMQYSIQHNVPLAHSPSAFDSERRYGMILSCGVDEYSSNGGMIILYGNSPRLICTDLLLTSDRIKKVWDLSLSKNPDLNIETLADQWIKKYSGKSKIAFAQSIEKEFFTKMPSQQYSAEMQLVGVGLAFDVPVMKSLLFMIASVRPLEFKDTQGHDFKGTYLGAVAAAGVGAGVQAGILGGISKNTAGSVLIYGGGSLGLIGGYAGIGWISIAPLKNFENLNR